MATSTIFVKNQNHILIKKASNDDIVNHIEAAVYHPYYDPEHGIMGITKVHDKFQQKDTVRYGIITELRDKVIKQFKSRMASASTGVLAIGRNGAGKTLCFEDIANKLITQDIPVLFVNTWTPVPILHKIVEEIVTNGTPLMVFIDEFGKLYNSKDEDSGSSREYGQLLKFFGDGALKGVLFCLSSNDYDDFVKKGIENRPSRFLIRMPVDFMEASTYIDLVKKSNAKQEVKDFLLLNTLEADMASISDGYSTDVLRFIFDNLVDKTTTCEKLRQDAVFYNIPVLYYHQYQIRPFDDKCKWHYKYIAFKKNVIELECVETKKKLKIKLDLEKIIYDSFQSKATKESTSGNLNHIDSNGNLHQFVIRIIAKTNKEFHGTMIDFFPTMDETSDE